MKIADGNNMPTTDGSRIQDQSADGEAQAAFVIPGGADPETSRFATVLDRVTRSHKEAEQRQAKQPSEAPVAVRFSKPRKDERPGDITSVAEPDRVLTPAATAVREMEPPDVHA